MKSELSKIAFDIQIEMDKKINSEKEELEKFSNEVIEELNSVIESTKKREENLAQDSQKYIEELKVKLDDIGYVIERDSKLFVIHRKKSVVAIIPITIFSSSIDKSEFISKVTSKAKK